MKAVNEFIIGKQSLRKSEKFSGSEKIQKLSIQFLFQSNICEASRILSGIVSVAVR